APTEAASSMRRSTSSSRFSDAKRTDWNESDVRPMEVRGGFIGLQGYKGARRQGYWEATRRRGDEATRLRGYEAARLQGCEAARLRGDEATRPRRAALVA